MKSRRLFLPFQKIDNVARDFIHRPRGGNDPGKWLVRQAEKNFPAALQGIALFKMIRLVAAMTDALQGDLHIEVKYDQEVGLRRELLVALANLVRVKTALTNKSPGPEIIAV